jgi:hypothetical protein
MTSREMTTTAGPSMLRVGQCAHGDAMQFLHVVLRPDLGTQQTQAHLHQSMIQVNQHDIVSPLATAWSKVMGRICWVCG